MRVIVAGEALIDLIADPAERTSTYHAYPGGGPFNVAVGLARLGVPTGFLGALSTDVWGSRIRRFAELHGVDLRFAVPSNARTALACTHQATEESAERFEFYGTRTADTQYPMAALPPEIPPSVTALHWGSLGLLRPPASRAFLRLVERERSRRTICLDPNVRAALIHRLDAYRQDLRGWTESADIIKCSIEDLRVIAPDRAPEAVALSWLRAGSSLVVMTRGSEGATAIAPWGALHVDAVPVDPIISTIGAGDAFTAGLLASLDAQGALARSDLQRITRAQVQTALSSAAHAAAAACLELGAVPAPGG